MATLLYIILSTLIVSLISFIGVIFLAISKNKLKKITLYLVALSAGVLLGGAFLHLIPEAIELGNESVFLYILGGFMIFFLIEKVLHWHHCHDGECPRHLFAHMNLIGDSVHNFIDGLIIAASFLVDFRLGIVTSFAIILHEVPQEIGDFGVLIHAGFTKKKALMYNFLTAVFALAGGIIGYFLVGNIEGFQTILLPIAAGGFLYIAAGDLIPELKRDIENNKSFVDFIVFAIGVLVMYLLKAFGVG